MRNPIFKQIKPNYRKKGFEITLKEGKHLNDYLLPFTVFKEHSIGTQNRVVNIKVEKDLGLQGASIELENGSSFDFPTDLVLYHCDPSYDWAPINQLKKVLRDELAVQQLSLRVIAAALQTSPTQVSRLLEENKASKQLLQLLQLAELAGYSVEFRLKEKDKTS